MEREAINATRAFFESCKCVFQEVDFGNDYGKDVYVDFTDNEELTGVCVALQIKGGQSYRRTGGYGIPLDDDQASVWRQSTIPIAGIVYDPDDRQLRWCNISAYLHDTHELTTAYVPVDRANVLTRETLEKSFKSTYASFHTQRIVGPALLNLSDQDQGLQICALRNCFVLGRTDGRVLIIIRHLLHLFRGDVLRLAVVILAHATPHPDILHHSKNWIPEESCNRLKPHLTWSIDEIRTLMLSADWEEWHRGGQGQNVYSLLCQDSDIEKKMGDVAIAALTNGERDLAFQAMYLVIYWARREGLEMYKGFLAIDRRFGDLPISNELRVCLEEHSCVTLFE